MNVELQMSRCFNIIVDDTQFLCFCLIIITLMITLMINNDYINHSYHGHV